MEPVVFLSDGVKYWLGPVSDIVSIEVEGNYSHVLISSGQKLMIRGSLAKWENGLPSSIFFKAGRDCIINLGKVTEIKPHNSKQLVFTMTGDNEVIMSRAQTIKFRRTRGIF
jgi:two-component system, LytTR family, response regulator